MILKTSDDGLNEAITALNNSGTQVAVLEDAKTPGNQSEVEAAVAGTKIAVVYAGSSQEYSVTPSAGGILSGTKYETVILVQGTQVSFSSRNSNVNPDTVQSQTNVLDLIKEVKQASELHTETGTGSSTPDFIGPVVGGGGVLLAVVAVTAVVFTKLKSNRKTRTNTPNYTEYVQGFPEGLKPYTGKLYQLSKKHDKLGSNSLSPEILQIIPAIQTLFQKIDKKAPEKKRVAEVEYKDKLQKLVTLLDEEHYINLVQYPEQWEDPEPMISGIRKATVAVYDEILKNIRQVNASKNLDFTVALGSLLSATDAPTLKEIYQTKEEK